MQGSSKAAAAVPVATPVLAAGGLAVAVLSIPALASVMWVAALVLVAVALVVAVRRERGSWTRGKTSVAATAFVLTAAIGFSVAWSAVGAV